MKNVISVDKILADVHWAGIMLHKPHAHDDPCVIEAKSKLHSLLISKLPEKRPVITADDLPRMQASNEAWNSAIDDVKAVLAELFEVKG